MQHGKNENRKMENGKLQTLKMGNWKMEMGNETRTTGTRESEKRTTEN